VKREKKRGCNRGDAESAEEDGEKGIAREDHEDATGAKTEIGFSL
jgi:hypothetical protein